MLDNNYDYDSQKQVDDQAADAVRKATDSISDAAKTVTDKTQELGRAAAIKIEDSRVSTAAALHKAASGIHPGQVLNIPA